MGHWLASSARLLLAAVLTTGCTPREPPAAPTAQVDPQTAGGAALKTQALGRDPEPSDEGLGDLLTALKDRFRCNSVSGCPAHAALIRYGWEARVPLEGTFARAPPQAAWRSRTVAILADLADPRSEELFVHLLDDRDPEVRAWSAIGLGNLQARQYSGKIGELALASDGLWLAPARLAGQYVLGSWGDRQAAADFSATLAELSRQQLATTSLMLGADLCLRPGAPDCSAALPTMARHPAFQARRAAMRAMSARLRPNYARALVFLLNDQAQSIRRDAEAALVALSGRGDLDGAEAWARWCEQGGCPAGADLH